MFKPKTIQEAIDNLAILPSYGFSDFESLCIEFQMLGRICSSYDELERRFKEHWISSWCCTDTKVGLFILSLDGAPIAVVSQTARKSTPHIEFFSRDHAIKTREALMELIEFEDPYLLISTISPSTEIPEYWYERGE